MVRKTKKDLLIFEEDSPLFVKKKTPSKSKTRTSPQILDDVIHIDEPVQPTRTRRRTVTQKPKNKNAPKYVIKSPSDCKHILPAFKTKLVNIWKLLESKNDMKAAEVVNYLRGVAIVARMKRPEEYEELMVLMRVAQYIISNKK